MKKKKGNSDPIETQLLQAADSGLQDEVQLLLKQESVDPNYTDHYGRTALSRAAERGHDAIVRMLLEHERIDPDFKDKNKRTPLSWAMESMPCSFDLTPSQRFPVVKLLLDQSRVLPDSTDSNGRTPLSRAAELGKAGIVQLLLEDGVCVDPNSKDNNHRTPLSWAMEHEHVYGKFPLDCCLVVKLLLGHSKVDPNLEDIEGRTPLWRAVELGKVGIVRVLLQQSQHVDPNSKDINGWTPLSKATELGEIEIVELLLQSERVDPNIKDATGQAPFWRAVKLGKVEIVKALLQQGQRVDPNSKDKYGETPLLSALEGFQSKEGIEPSSKSRYTMIEMLINHDYINPNVKDTNGRTPLSRAVQLEQFEVVEMLLRKENIDPNAKDEQGCAPLFWAVEQIQNREIIEYPSRGNPMVELLLSHPHIDPNVRNVNGTTPLLRAVELGHYETVEMLLKKGNVDPNAKDEQGRTPLLGAVECLRSKKLNKSRSKKSFLKKSFSEKNLSVIQLLINHDNVDLNVKDINGQTPLSLAIKLGHFEVVEILLKKKNIDPNAKDEQGCAPLFRVVEQIRNREFINYPPRGSSIVELLLNHPHIDPNIRNVDGTTPLLRAVELGHYEAVEMLLINQDNVDPNAKDINGRTPLSRAVELNHYEAVDSLLKKSNIDINERDGQGRTPLFWAVESFQVEDHIESYSQGPTSLIKLLVDHHTTDLNISDENGRTPLSRAAELGHYTIVEMLLKNGRTSLDSKDRQGRTPLSWAVEYPEVEKVEKYFNQSPLYSGFTVLDQLLQCDVDLNSKDIHGRTPLSRAAELGRIRAVTLFLADNHIDPDLKDNNGRTPLWWAAGAGQEAVVNLLLERSTVDPESTDGDSKTPLLRASENNHKAIVRQFFLKDTTTLHIIVRKKNLALVKFLINADYDLNTKDMHGQTPLHVAASLGHSDIAKELIHSRADINCEDVNGVTPLVLAIQKKQQDTIQLLLQFSARTIGISLNDWLDAYGKKTRSVVLEMSQSPGDKQSIRFIDEMDAQTCHTPELNRRLFLFVDYSSWLRHHARSLGDDLHVEESEIFHKTQVHQQYDNIFVIGCFPINPSGNQEEFAISHWNRCGVAWTVIRPSNAKDGSYWRSTDLYGTLPYGWIPDSSAEFFALFIRNLEEKWLVLCNSAEEHLSKRRTDQLSERGTNPKLIHRLAEDAQQWAMLRKVLRGQVSSAKRFAVEYCRRYGQGRGLSVMVNAIDNFDIQVSDHIDRLENTVKDLLQLEFAWVTVNETHRSITLSTSIKRLSWITFIFLPPMFVSSLFGMNVNILETNPDWRWYLVFGGGCLFLTVSVWLLFKFGQIETLVEKYIGIPLQQFLDRGARYKKRKISSPQALP